MQRRIIGYHRDDADDWVARLECDHFQHVRHQPPWFNRPWVMTAAGRGSRLGCTLNCKKCDADKPPDSRGFV